MEKNIKKYIKSEFYFGKEGNSKIIDKVVHSKSTSQSRIVKVF